MGKKIKNLVTYLFIGIISLLYIVGLLTDFTNFISPLFENDENKIVSANGFKIEKYNVILDVKEDNKVDVNEYITVDWYGDNHHGIDKFIPQWLKYTGKDGKTIKRKAKITNLKAINEPFSIDWVKKKARIKTGDPDEYVSEGEKQYIISYTYDMGADPYKNFDEFIFHIYGDYWGTQIKNASIEINMPKSIEGYNIKFFSDKYRKDDITSEVNYSINGNTLFAEVDPDYYLFKSLTLDIELPENYFVGGSWNYGWGSLCIIIVIIILTILTIFKWIKYGKDLPKKSKTVEFYPPENYSSAEIGYIYNQYSTKKLTISLIVQLASKGYIKIDELKDKKNNIQITNLYPKPHALPKFENTIPQRVISIKKLKDSDENLSKDSVTMMAHLFKKQSTKELTSNIDKFLKVKDELLNGGYIEIINDNENDPSRNVELLQKEYKQKELEYHKEMDEYREKVSKLKSLSEYEKEIYNRLFEKEDVVIISEHKTLYKSFDNVDRLLNKNLKDKLVDAKSTNKMISSIIICIIVFVLYFISYSIVEDMDPSWSILYIISFICIFINIFFTIFMKRKTEYGEEIKAKVEGFRDFLIKAEKPKLEELVSQNPQYFYDILPYTYVLNISKTWIKKFEDIPMPEMDMGNMDYSSDSSLYSIYDNLYIPDTVYSSNSSSCGGGCSSCGGGCSSCGGGGSW